MVITLAGDNGFARDAELKHLMREFVLENGEISLERLDCEEAELSRIDEALSSLPFLASQKMVVIKNAGSSKQFAEAAENLLDNLPDSTQLILIDPKFDRRSKLYKLLQKKTDFREFGSLTGADLAKWLIGYAKTKDAVLHNKEANFLIERVGENQQLLASEIDKLAMLNDEITRENIQKVTDVAPSSTIFQLIESALAGDHKKAMKLYNEQRSLKVEPQQIIAMLAWQLHVLALMKTAAQRSPDEVARDGGINPFVVRKNAAAAKRIGLMDLKSAIYNLLLIDKRLKRESIDADEALKFYILSLNQSN